jgi:O-antigen/teichoic acid export membrane protein
MLPGVRLTLTMRGSMLGELLRFSAAVTVYQVAGNVFLLLEKGWIARRLGPAALTYYVVPMTIAVYIHAFITSLTLILFPLASEASAKGDGARLHVIYSRAMKYICVPVVFLVMALVVGGERLLNEWMGPEFARSCEGVLKVHAISFGVLALLIVPWQIADGSGFPGRNAAVSVLWLLIGIPVAALLTPKLGIRGTAFARLAAMATIPVYMMYIEHRVFGRLLTEMWRRIGLCVPVAGGAAAACLAGMLHLFPGGRATFAGSVAASGLLMTGVLWAMGYLDQDEKKRLLQLVGYAPGDLAA